jgi:hypothetical protein
VSLGRLEAGLASLEPNTNPSGTALSAIMMPLFGVDPSIQDCTRATPSSFRVIVCVPVESGPTVPRTVVPLLGRVFQVTWHSSQGLEIR